jgi:hypothetical protein
MTLKKRVNLVGVDQQFLRLPESVRLFKRSKTMENESAAVR